jgi:short-subunit dehydrogenase
MTDLKNKTVIITGAANGLGKALAIEFYRQGCHLVLIDVNLRGLQGTKRDLEISEQKITIHQADVSNEGNIIAARLEILNHHDRIDMLVNNAAISISQHFEQIDLADYKNLFDINFWGTVYCTRHFLPDLKKQNDSRIVNIISDFAFMGFPGKTAYGSSKSAVLGFTNALTTELTSTSVKVCLVIPPPLDTGLVRNSRHIDDKKRESETLFLKKNGLPLGETAKKIVNQIRKGKYRIVIGMLMFWIDLLSRLFPTRLHQMIGKNKKRFDFI